MEIPYADIATALGLIKQSTDIVKDVSPLFKKPADQEKFQELHKNLLDARDAILNLRETNQDLQDRVRKLEKALSERDEFLSNRENYTLHKLNMGAFVYVPKDAAKPVDQQPWYCQHCFDVKHLLSPVNLAQAGERRIGIFKCGSCGNSFPEYI